MTLVWFLCALLPPFFHAISALADQYVIREHTAGSPFLFLAFSGFVCLPIAAGIAFFAPVLTTITANQALWIIVCAWLFSACCIPYFYAMEDTDAHEFTPVFQVSPVFVTLLCWVILGENLTLYQIMGGLIVIMAAAASMMDFHRIRFQTRAFWLIFAAMIFYALFVTGLRIIAPHIHWMVTTFWLCIGWTLLPVIIMTVSPGIRKTLIAKVVKTRGRLLPILPFKKLRMSWQTARAPSPLVLPWFRPLLRI